MKERKEMEIKQIDINSSFVDKILEINWLKEEE